jgi:hypothetical protein
VTLLKETVIPSNHNIAGDLQHDEVHQLIDYLAQHHLFDPNYGAK